jgi:RNA polymerase sigma-70 factor, ECF subfamily
MRPIDSSHGSAVSLRRSARDATAFGAFYRANDVQVLAFFARRTYDVEVSRDLTAETFAQAFRGRRRFRGSTDEEARGWLYAIARNLLSRYERRGAVERKAVDKLGIDIPPLEDGDVERTLQLADLADVRHAIAHAFDSLSETQREAVRLRVVDELSYGEVARRLDVSEATARARVSRGLRQLAEALDRTGNLRETTA